MEFSIVWSFSLLGRELVLFTAQQLSPNSQIDYDDVEYNANKSGNDFTEYNDNKSITF